MYSRGLVLSTTKVKEDHPISEKGVGGPILLNWRARGEIARREVEKAI